MGEGIRVGEGKWLGLEGLGVGKARVEEGKGGKG